MRRARALPARHDIVSEGDTPPALTILIEGWAQRYKLLPDGRRQILSFLLPGDLCPGNAFAPRPMDHSIATVTDVRLIEFTAPELERLIACTPVREGLWTSELNIAAMQREWTTSAGQRSAYERIGHLLAELFIRMNAIGLVRDHACDCPLTQTELGDATGMTPVHVNRIIQELRKDGLIELRARRLTVHDLRRLMAASLFNPAYLWLAPGTIDRILAV